MPTAARSITRLQDADDITFSGGAGDDAKHIAWDNGTSKFIMTAVTTDAPTDAEYVVLSLDGTLSAERVLTGTANQITITDGGAGGNATLSTPQDIDTSATPTFDSMTLESANGVDYNPGSDTDADLITVGVTGAPVLKWDESENAFDFSTIIQLPTTSSTAGQIKQNGDTFLHTYGTSNIFMGLTPGNFTLTGSENVGIGAYVLDALTSGEDNVAIGAWSLSGLTTGINNVAIGSNAARFTTTGQDNVALGSNALQNNTTGSNCFGMGSQALLSNTTGTDNIGIGNGAGRANETAVNNVAIGGSALRVSTGASNVAIGANTLSANTSGGNNVASGYAANSKSQTGSDNVTIGHQAARGTSSHSKHRNVMIGYRVGYVSQGADNNILIGFQAADNLTTGDNNIIIAYDTDASAVDISNELNIGGVVYGTLTANQNITINATTVSANYDLMLAGDGVLGLKETTTPTADTNYGKVYCKNDDKLYFQDGAGAEHEVAFV